MPYDVRPFSHSPLIQIILVMSLFCGMLSCAGETEMPAEAVNDSLPQMHARGINTLISDSGVMRYRLVAEEWDIFGRNNEPATWKFLKGLLMERFDENFHVDMYVQADTAYLHRQRTWELRGRVVVRNTKGDVFLTEELFWDITDHEMWNHQYMHIITPERELEGTEFRSNEQMTKYSVSNSAGSFPVSDTDNSTVEEEVEAAPDGSADMPPASSKPIKTAAPKKQPIKFNPRTDTSSEADTAND